MRRPVCILLSFLAVLVLAIPATASMRTPSVLNPREYASPSGEFVLHVDPSDLYGRGPADYRLARKGKLTWSGTSRLLSTTPVSRIRESSPASPIRMVCGASLVMPKIPATASFTL